MAGPSCVVSPRPTRARAFTTFKNRHATVALVLLIGVDDTDSRAGGCTTVLAQALVAAFAELTPAGPPRLVRLHPQVRHKTRGNAAVALAFVDAPDGGLDAALARARDVVAAHARTDPGTQPGIVVAHEPPPAAFYDAAVTRTVSAQEAAAARVSIDARVWGGRGLIGATAALAWPAAARAAAAGTTWERIAYRAAATVGRARDVDASRVAAIDAAFPSLFDSYDESQREVVCVPRSPCPVLWGLRGDDADELARAAATLGPQRPEYETLFLTNQASDDHLIEATLATAMPDRNVRVTGRVIGRAREQGGVVFIELEDDGARLRLAAYPPTGRFRALVAMLAAGDEVVACGSVRLGPDGAPTLGLEKFALLSAAPRKVANPRCPVCARAMRSAGRGAGYRCRAGHARLPEQAAPTRAAPLALGWHEVPPRARRHLAMPLQRLLGMVEGGGAVGGSGARAWDLRRGVCGGSISADIAAPET